jgi:RimJ/RimL family protein N-acetyltransferase
MAGQRTVPTENVRLRDVTEDDLPIFFEHQRDPDATRMASFAAREWDAFLAHWDRIMTDPAVFVQTVLVDEQVAGNVVSWESEGIRLVGYWFGKPWWGRGVASAALAEFLRQVAIRPLYARVAKDNANSIRVLEKCGFAPCKELPQALSGPSDWVEELVLELRMSGAAEADTP